jgi:ribosomal protein S12 methylthiotransferase
MKRVGILSLGCARNLVDSEVLAGRLKNKGYQIVDVDKADIALVNTCAFIKEAKEESIQTILDLIEAKSEGRLKRIIVAGCLTQRYKHKLLKLLPEIDAFLGVISLNHTQAHFRLSPAHYAYVKICEGCINRCSFCAIPGIKPRLTSREIKSIIDEIKTQEARSGVVEINLIGQDITTYGWDLYGEFRLVELIKQILKNSKKVNWLRLLYLSAERLSDELIELIASEPRIVKYIDLPLQHINNRILKLMQRGINSYQIFKLIDKIRKKIPDAAIRSSLIVGFPTETDKEFKQLLDFVQKVKFERLGLFMYSREEGTPAFDFNGQIPQRVKEKRYNIIMSAQQEISRGINEKFLGKIIKVLIEEKVEDGLPRPCMQGRGLYIGRSQYDAPEVDGLVYVKAEKELPIGNFVDVKITDTWEYDLVGQIKDE